MYTSFYVSDSHIDELKFFVRTEMPTARFKHNPLKEGDKWFVALEMEVAENNKLNTLFNKWENEEKSSRENKPIDKRPKGVIGLLLEKLQRH